MLVGWGTYQVVADSMGVGWGAPGGRRRWRSSAAVGGSFSSVTIYLAILIGGITFTGSIIAWGKLSGAVTQKPVLFTGQNVVNFLIVLAILVGAVWFTVSPDQYWIAVVATASGAAARHHGGDPDRRRRHAGGDLAAQQLLGTGGVRSRLRDPQQPADHHRRPGRRQRHHPHQHHVQGDEPLAGQRAVQRLRRGGRLNRRPAPSRARPSRCRPATPTTYWRRPARWW